MRDKAASTAQSELSSRAVGHLRARVPLKRLFEVEVGHVDEQREL